LWLVHLDLGLVCGEVALALVGVDIVGIGQAERWCHLSWLGLVLERRV